jgi:hypothetical protein
LNIVHSACDDIVQSGDPERTRFDVFSATQRFGCIEGLRRRRLSGAANPLVALRAFARINFCRVRYVTRLALLRDLSMRRTGVERLVLPVAVAAGSGAR